MTTFRSLARTMLAAAALALTGTAFAAPVCADRVIKLVIPQPAGGVGDVVGRILAEKASSFLEQPIIVENKGGASTTIGTGAVAAAKPDGCTILHMTNTAVVASAINDKLPYDLERDLQPVIGVGSFPMALTVRESSKFKTFADFVAAAKSDDGLLYSTGGAGTMAHLASLRLLKDIGGKGIHVPYRGNAPALQGLLAGDVNFMFPTTFEAMPLVQANKVRVLGITSDARLPTFSNVPTMKELGLGDFNPRIWYAFLLPAGAKPDVVARFHDAFAQAVMDPGIQAQLTARGYIPEAKSTAETAAFIKSEYMRWKKVVQENGVTALD